MFDIFTNVVTNMLMLLIFTLIKFCKIFCCLRLYITHGCWAIEKLVFYSIGAIPPPARVKLDQDIDKVYFIKKTIEYFICSYWKPEWFEKLYQSSIAIGMVNSQVASRKRLDVFCWCWRNLITKNGLPVQCL